jgi:hypothetical protein
MGNIRTILKLIGQALSALFLLTALATSVQAQCGGQITLSATSLEWSGTQVGFPVQQTVLITNTGLDQLCLFSVTSTSPAWLVSYDPLPIPPGGWTTMTVDFVPAFDRWYSGMIEIYSSDETSPRDSVSVLARACQPALAPGAPLTMPPMSPYMLYWAIPWDENPDGVEYAAQLRKLPDEEIFYCTLHGGLDLVPNWHTAIGWARDGEGAFVALEPSENYELTLLARDCMGNISVGVTVPVFMPTEIEEAPISDFTIHATTEGGPVELRWDPEVTDMIGNSLPFDGYYVLAGNHPDSIDQLYGESYENFLELPVSDAKKHFTVYGLTNGTYWGTNPFFIWPPDNAPLYGMNTVALRDPANWSEWSSVLIQIDSMGWMVDLLWMDHEDLQGASAITLDVDFDQYGIGPRTISATVTDLSGMITTAFKPVNVVQRPQADFTTVYDPILRIFSLGAINVVTPVPYTDIWWPISTVDERYGSFIQFESKAGEDSLHIVVPKPILASKILNEELPWPQPTDPTYGVIVDVNAPGNFQVVGNNNPAGPCCKEVTIEYDDANTDADSCFVTCVASGQNEGSITCRAGCRFDFSILWEWNPQPLNTSWVILSKFTIQDIDGECVPGPGNTNVFVPAVGAKATRTKNFKEQGVEHPYAGGTVDTLDSRKTVKPTKSAGVNAAGKPFGKTSARPADRNRSAPTGAAQHKKDSTLKNKKSMAVRLVGDCYFRIIAHDECPGADCDDEYEVRWDIVCCPNCDKIITRAPAVVQLP